MPGTPVPLAWSVTRPEIDIAVLLGSTAPMAGAAAVTPVIATVTNIHRIRRMTPLPGRSGDIRHHRVQLLPTRLQDPLAAASMKKSSNNDREPPMSRMELGAGHGLPRDAVRA